MSIRCAMPLKSAALVALFGLSLAADVSAQTAPDVAKPTSAQAAFMSNELAATADVAAGGLVEVVPGPPTALERSSAQAPGVVAASVVAFDAARLAELIASSDLMIDSSGRIAGRPRAFPVGLPGGSEARLVKLDAARDGLGNLTIRAVLAGERPGTATLVVDGNQVTGAIKFGGRTFSIMPSGEGRHRITEIDLARLSRVRDDAIRSGGPNAPPREAPAGTSPSRERSQSATERPPTERASATHNITLLVVYTPAAASVISNIKSAISLAVADANTSFNNSLIDGSIRLVGIDRVNYAENGANMSDVLEDLSDGTGDFARAQEVRKALGADLISVVARTSDACGLAWLNDRLDVSLSQGISYFGASLVAADSNGSCIVSNTLAHEIGHNLGAEHDRFVSDDDEPGPTKFGYGYVDTVARIRDIMAYNDECASLGFNCNEVEYFSNPNITFSGRPLGVPFNQPAAADASRKISGSLVNAVRLRTQLSAPTSPILSVLVEGQGTVTSAPAGINCGDNCAVAFTGAPQVSLTATASARAAMSGWSGACTGTGACSVSLASSKAVTATFEAAERSGPIFSTVQTASKSFLRFYNSGTTAGTVTVTMRDFTSGSVLGAWTSPSIAAGAAPQFPIDTVESAIPAGTAKPAYYAITIRPGISGFFQHVLFRPADGTLTNLSTCEASSTANSRALTNVHTTILDNGYPSSIAIVNTGANDSQAVLGIYDARDGTRLGTYNSVSISDDAQAVVTVAAIQAQAGIVPNGQQFHYVIRIENDFTGFLQHLVNNQQAGVITDMTTACTFGTVPTPVATEALIKTGPLYASAESQSFLRFINSGASAGTVNVTLYNPTSGARLGRWTSPSIAAGAAPQFPITTIETAINPGVAKPAQYSAHVEAQMDGVLQHVLFRAADGTLTNLSTCSAAVGATANQLANVHTTVLDTPGYPSSVAVYNTGGAAASATLGIFDAVTGARLGTYSTPSIAAGGQAVLTVAAIEQGAGITPVAGQLHHVIRIENSFRGFLQHLVNNQRAGVITDMTTVCTLPTRAVSYTDCAAGFLSACNLPVSATATAGQVKRNGGFEFYRASLTAGRTYTIDIKGVDSGSGTLASPFLFVQRTSDFGVASQGGGGGTGRDLRRTFTPDTSADFYIVVTGSTLTSNGIVVANPSGTYTISLQ